MNNCQVKALLVDDVSFACYCNGCSKLSIGIGNVVIAICSKELEKLTKSIENTWHRHRKTDHDPLLKYIVISTPSQDVSLLFNLQEIEQFVHFLKRLKDKLTIRQLADSVFPGDTNAALN